MLLFQYRCMKHITEIMTRSSKFKKNLVAAIATSVEAALYCEIKKLDTWHDL